MITIMEGSDKANIGGEGDAKGLLTGVRRAHIVEMVMQQGRARVGELSEKFGVSEVTIRGDLEVLAREGRLVRDRGGAIALARPTITMAFEQRSQRNLDRKRAIGQVAASLVEAGETILLDAGTTVMEMAKFLVASPPASPLTVVTNSLNIAAHLATLPDLRILLAGGWLDRNSVSTLGSLAERDIGDLVVDKVFLGAHALNATFGVSDTSVEAAQVKAAMARSGREVILLADSSKWNHTGFARAVQLSQIQVLITDEELPESARKTIEASGVRVVIARPNTNSKE